METYLKTLTVQAPLVQMPTLQAQAVNLQERDYKIELGSLLSLKGKTTLITGIVVQSPLFKWLPHDSSNLA